MTTKGKLTTKGFEEYLEQIAQAGQDVDAAVGEALHEGGEILLSGMQRRAPKDTHNLESNLELTAPQQDGNFVFVEVGIKKGVDADTARYGNAQEYGWTSRSGHRPGQSYIRATLDEDMKLARRKMKEIFERWLGRS